MNRRTWCMQGLLLTGALIALGSGCDSSKPVASSPAQPAPTQTVEPTVKMPGPPTPKIPGPPGVSEAPAVSPLQPATPQATDLPATPPEPPATPTEVVKADVGVAQQGRSLDNVSGPFVTEAKAFFGFREKAVFQIAIPEAIKLYTVENEVPLTLEEFQEKVLVPNKIKLPPLPPGHTYEWDPEQKQLNVRRPAK